MLTVAAETMIATTATRLSRFTTATGGKRLGACWESSRCLFNARPTPLRGRRISLTFGHQALLRKPSGLAGSTSWWRTLPARGSLLRGTRPRWISGWQLRRMGRKGMGRTGKRAMWGR